jgi:hypothetical protein
VATEQEQENGPETKDIPGLPAIEKAALAANSDSAKAALKEAKQLSSGRTLQELEEDAKRAEHARDQGFRDLFEKLVKAGMLGAFGAVMLMGAAWIWHLITPENWQWLSEQQIDHIQGMVTGGVIAVVVGDHFKRRLG